MVKVAIFFKARTFSKRGQALCFWMKRFFEKLESRLKIT